MRLLATLICVIASHSLFQLAEAQSSIMRRVTDPAEWRARSAAKLFMNLHPLSLIVGEYDEPDQAVDRQYIPSNSLFVYGGMNENAMSNDDAWVSTNNGKSWSLVGGKRSYYAGSSLPDRLFSAACVDRVTGRVYSIGGTPDGRLVNMTNRVASSADGVHWEVMTDAAPFGHRNRAACSVNAKGQIYLAGGNVNGESVQDVWRSEDLGATWRQITRSGQFGRRSGMSMNNYTSTLLESELLYIVGGEVYSGNSHKVTNDIFISSNGNSWSKLTDRASFPARTHAQLTIASNGILIVSGGAQAESSGKGYLNDIWASLDGGWTFGSCCRNCLPSRADHSAMLDSRGHLIIVGGGSEPAGPEAYQDVWQSAFSFFDAESVAERCSLELPKDEIVGLRCWPGEDDCGPVDPDDPDDPDDGHHGGDDKGSNGGKLSIEAVLGILGAVIFSLALLFYIVRRFRGWQEAKRKERETELQYLNQGLFDAPTVHSNLVPNAYDRSDQYQPPQPHANAPPAF